MPRARERARRFGRFTAWLAAVAVVLVPALSGAASAQGAAGSGTYVGRLYFTTFQNSGTCNTAANPKPCTANVFRVDYAYDAATPSFNLGAPQAVATLPGADGIVFSPSGQNLVVGGQNSGKLFQVDPATGASTSVQSGDAGSFHVALGPSGKQVWTSGSLTGDPGVPTTVPLNPLQNGTPHPLQGDSTQITELAFVPSQPGIAYYTASNWPGGGCFGILNLNTYTTKCVIPNMAAAHGITYDPFTKDLILVGANQIVQVTPSNPPEVKSIYTTTMTNGGVQARFDQAAVDGVGHLFASWNGGNLLFMDYSASGLVGSAQNFVATPYLHANLDDVVNEMPEVPFAGGLLVVALGLTLWTWRRRRRHRSDGDVGLSLGV